MTSAEEKKPFCSGLEHLSPWRQLDDYCRHLARKMSGILWEDFRKSAEDEGGDLPLLKKLYGIYLAKRETEDFFEKIMDEHALDNEASLQIAIAWNKFEAKWDDFVREFKLNDEMWTVVCSLGKNLDM
jgi:hypothetical protein